MDATYLLLERIFIKCNEKLFKLDALPWRSESRVTSNIITSMKRRINVAGMRSLMCYQKLNEAEQDVCNQLIRQGLVVTIDISESDSSIVITESGMLYLNEEKLNEETATLIDSEALVTKVKLSIANIMTENLRRRCGSVLSNTISNQEAVLALFLLLNGAVSSNSAYLIRENTSGSYLYGEFIVKEMNRLGEQLFGQETLALIEDEKELRNVLGRNGSNGRLAKTFPNWYMRQGGQIWFEVSSSENELLTMKEILLTILRALSKRYSQSDLLASLQDLIEQYMINNPLQTYIVEEVFLGGNNFQPLVTMHIAVKDIVFSESAEGHDES